MLHYSLPHRIEAVHNDGLHLGQKNLLPIPVAPRDRRKLRAKLREARHGPLGHVPPALVDGPVGDVGLAVGQVAEVERLVAQPQVAVGEHVHVQRLEGPDEDPLPDVELPAVEKQQWALDIFLDDPVVLLAVVEDLRQGVHAHDPAALGVHAGLHHPGVRRALQARLGAPRLEGRGRGAGTLLQVLGRRRAPAVPLELGPCADVGRAVRTRRWGTLVVALPAELRVAQLGVEDDCVPVPLADRRAARGLPGGASGASGASGGDSVPGLCTYLGESGFSSRGLLKSASEKECTRTWAGL
mmetsp:Transcript_125003/g.353821  ORF Transcript_125003/g.353821 Transcript_125003/m.353821 type:complete len:298 (-) Transcript_125003:98-991(-)